MMQVSGHSYPDGGNIDWDMLSGGQLGDMTQRPYNFMYLVILKLQF